ncbi:MAG: M56 family metallopeptidase [Pseudomonadota bacterium]
MSGSVSENLIFVGQTSLAVTVLIALVLLVRRPFAKHFGAKAAYALWAIPAIRLVLPPLPEGWSLFSPVGRATEAAIIETPTPILVNAGGASLRAPLSPLTEALPTAPISPIGAPTVTSGSTGWVSELLSGLAVGPVIFAIWAMGALGYLAWSVYRQSVFSRIVQNERETASPTVLTQAMEICQSIGFDHRKVSIQMSFISDSPFVTGLFRPVIVLPAWFELDYSAQEREVALMHELMHVKRRDLWALQISTLFLALQWFNPAAHYAMSAFRSDQEASCDADVIGVGCSTPHAYGATLVKAVRKSRPAGAPMMAASLSLTNSLTERLKQLRNPLPTLRRRLMGTAITATVGSVALIASACTTASAHPHEQGQELDGGPLAENEERDGSDRKRHFIVHHNSHGDQLILLDNPMDDIQFDVEAIEGLSSLIEAEALQMEDLLEENVTAITTDIVTAVADVAADLKLQIEDGELNLDLSEADIQATGDIMAFVGEVIARTASGDISEDELDAFTDDFEARIEDWTDDIETRVEAFEPVLEARVEAYTERWNDRIEARIEAHTAEIERHSEIIESHAGRIEEAGEVIGDLANECSSEPGLRVVSEFNNSTGKRYKAVCLDPASGLTKDEIMDQLRASGELTDAELDKVCERFDQNASVSFDLEWNFDED